MKKIISIVIPSYNMEKHLKCCLDSVLDHKWDDDIEVIVVNDGSKDHSLQIAIEYKEKFPKAVIIINKDNGHYGSTINTALSIVKGKYIKILDADDWFNTEDFSYFVEKLKEIDSDLIITNYTRNYISGKKIQHIFPLCEYNMNYDFSVMLSSTKLSDIEMHAVSYRTELLHQINYKQTEKLPYTDMEWTFYPLFFVNTITFINANIYQYLLGREGQSVDISFRLKNLNQYSQVVDNLFSYYSNFDVKKIEEYKNKYLWNKIVARYRYLYAYYLLHQSHKNFDAIEMKNFDRNVKEKSEQLYLETANIVVHKFLPFPYIRYWRRYSKRLPRWIIRILKICKRSSSFLKNKKNKNSIIC